MFSLGTFFSSGHQVLIYSPALSKSLDYFKELNTRTLPGPIPAEKFHPP